MSWVTDIILIFSSAEVTDAPNSSLYSLYDRILSGQTRDPNEIREELETNEMIPPLVEIDRWLEEREIGRLDRLDSSVTSGGKIMQARVYGGAFNYLPINEFLEVVKSQNWQFPQQVQLLIKDEEEERFTLHAL